MHGAGSVLRSDSGQHGTSAFPRRECPRAASGQLLPSRPQNSQERVWKSGAGSCHRVKSSRTVGTATWASSEKCFCRLLLSEFHPLVSRKDVCVPREHEAPQDKKTDRAGDGYRHFLGDWRELPASGNGWAHGDPELRPHTRGPGTFTCGRPRPPATPGLSANLAAPGRGRFLLHCDPESEPACWQRVRNGLRRQACSVGTWNVT